MREASGIFRKSFGSDAVVSFRHTNHDALPCSSEEHPVGIEHIFLVIDIVLRARRRRLFGKADACYCASKLKQAMMAFLMGAASGWLVLRMVRMVRI